MTATSTSNTRASRLVAALARPVPADSLHALRTLFGGLMLIAVARFFVGDQITAYFHAPTHFFHYLGFAWVRPLPAPWMHVAFALMGALALCVTLGFHHRVAAAGFGVLFAYAHLCDKTNYLNHYYLIVQMSFVLALLPVAARAEAVPTWALWALRVQVGLVYFFGGVAKLGHDWLIEAQPLTIWLHAREDFPLLGGAFQWPWLPHAASWAAAAFDLGIVAFLCWRRSRPLAYTILVVFHVVTARLFHLGMFPWVMIALSTVFFAPDWPAELRRRLRRDAPAPVAAPAAPATSRLVPAVLAAHLALQLLLPWRSLFYPGATLWTEQGFRFAWKVMLMEKSGLCDFRVREPASGRTWIVPASDYYTRYQAGMMATQPDMILEAAQQIAADFRARGVRDPEVRADAFVSLNGRPRTRFVDPDVDLARVHDGLAAIDWILPETH